MSNPLKQIIRFSLSAGGVEKANEWLSDRNNEDYTTEFFVTGGEYASVTIIYWKE